MAFEDDIVEYENLTVEELTALDNNAKASQQLEHLAMRVQVHLEWSKSSNGRKKAEDRWRDAWKFWKSEQWDGIKSFGIPGRDAARKRMKPCPVDNYFKAQIEGIVGDICDSPTDVTLTPTEPDSAEALVLAYDACIQHIFQVNKFDRQKEFSVRSAELYGPMISKVVWDGEWVGGRMQPFIGEVRIIPISCDNFFSDPRIKANEPGAVQQAEFNIYAVKRSLKYIRDRFPEKGGSVSADSYASYVSTISDDISDSDISPEDMSALLIEYWYKGEPMAPNFPATLDYPPFTDLQGNGVHVATIAGGVLLEHKTYVYPKYPFAMDWLYPSEESIYGYGDAHDMLVPQLIINKLNEIAIEAHSVYSLGNWVTDEGNIRNVASFQKYATTGGSVLPVVDASRIKREVGNGVSSSLFNHYSQEQRAMETVSGRTDITQGRSPRGIRAASAIALLLQQAAGRIRQRTRAVASYVEQIVDLAILNVGHFYTDERLIRLDGVEEQPVWVTVGREDLVRVLVYTDPITGEQIQTEFIPEFDIKVNVGSETPTSRAYYAEQAVQLFDKGVIDDIALLETLDFPRWKQALDRKSQKMAQQAAITPPPVGPAGAPAMPGDGSAALVSPIGGGGEAPAIATPPELQATGDVSGSLPQPEGGEIPQAALEQIIAAQQGNQSAEGEVSDEELAMLISMLKQRQPTR